MLIEKNMFSGCPWNLKKGHHAVSCYSNQIYKQILFEHGVSLSGLIILVHENIARVVIHMFQRLDLQHLPVNLGNVLHVCLSIKCINYWYCRTEGHTGQVTCCRQDGQSYCGFG